MYIGRQSQTLFSNKPSFSIEKIMLYRTGRFHNYGYEPTGYPGTHLGPISWTAFLNDSLGRLAPIEISKLASANRPTNFAQILNGDVPHWEIIPYTYIYETR